MINGDKSQIKQRKQTGSMRGCARGESVTKYEALYPIPPMYSITGLPLKAWLYSIL